jgi:hypothetical protein
MMKIHLGNNFWKVVREKEEHFVQLRADQTEADLDAVLDAALNPVEPARTYRDLRKAAYIREIGGGDPVEGFGNMMDALYWRDRGNPEQWDAYLVIIDEIKARFPKS